MDDRCQKCGDYYACRDGCDPTTFCDSCAQTILSTLENLVPEPPTTITSEIGATILNTLQKELYTLPYKETEDTNQ